MSTPTPLSQEYEGEELTFGAVAGFFELQQGDVFLDPTEASSNTKNESGHEIVSAVMVDNEVHLGIQEINNQVIEDDVLLEVMVENQVHVGVQEINNQDIEDEGENEGGLVIVEDDEGLEGLPFLFQENNEVEDEDEDGLDGLQLLFLEIPEPLDLHAFLQLHLDNG